MNQILNQLQKAFIVQKIGNHFLLISYILFVYYTLLLNSFENMPFFRLLCPGVLLHCRFVPGQSENP